MVEGALDTSEEVAPLTQIERAESELYGRRRGRRRRQGQELRRSATRLALANRPRRRSTAAATSVGITTGLDGINAKIGGMHKSDLVILAGRPGMGKTSLATNIAFAAAQRFVRDRRTASSPPRVAGAPVAFFSLEMSADQLATRILAEQSGISSRESAHGQDQPAGVPSLGPRRGRA